MACVYLKDGVCSRRVLLFGTKKTFLIIQREACKALVKL